MRSLVRALRTTRSTIPVPWPSLRGIASPRPGHLAICLGAPGVGKSTFGLLWALKLHRPALVVSLDTDLWTQAIRVAAALSGRRTAEIETDVAQWARWLDQQDVPVRFSDLPMEAEQIGDLIGAEAEFWGEPPALVVVDNAGNLLAGEEGPVEYRRIFSALHQAAKRHATTILALHHLHRGPSASGTMPVSLADGLYSGEQEAEMVLGIWRPNQTQMFVGMLKNRIGRMAPDGSLNIALDCDLDRCALEEPNPIHIYRQSIGMPA